MDMKFIDEFKVVYDLMSGGLDDNDEICKILKEKCHLNNDGAVQVLSKYYDDIKEIKEYFKNQNNDKKPLQMGE